MKTNARIINTQGQVLKSVILLKGNQIVDVNNLQQGVYFLQTEKGSLKFVKQ